MRSEPSGCLWEEVGEAEGPARTETLGRENGWLEPRGGREAGEEIKELIAGRPECVNPAGP